MSTARHKTAEAIKNVHAYAGGSPFKALGEMLELQIEEYQVMLESVEAEQLPVIQGAVRQCRRLIATISGVGEPKI